MNPVTVKVLEFTTFHFHADKKGEFDCDPNFEGNKNYIWTVSVHDCHCEVPEGINHVYFVHPSTDISVDISTDTPTICRSTCRPTLGRYNDRNMSVDISTDISSEISAE